jgi:hypothetical protein
MTLKRCEKCLGKKTFLGLGNMIEKCSDCKGVGYLSDTKEPVNSLKKERKKRTLNNEYLEKASC